jgi:hypothetical protein
LRRGCSCSDGGAFANAGNLEHCARYLNQTLVTFGFPASLDLFATDPVPSSSLSRPGSPLLHVSFPLRAVCLLMIFGVYGIYLVAIFLSTNCGGQFVDPSGISPLFVFLDTCLIFPLYLSISIFHCLYLAYLLGFVRILPIIILFFL